MTEHQQDMGEMAVFRAFAEVCPLHIGVDSIVKQYPPEVDIVCLVEGDGGVEFELTEIVDRGVARRCDTQVSIQPRLLNLWRELPDEQKDRVRGMNVVITLVDEASKGAKEKAEPEIIEALVGTDAGFIGDVAIENKAVRRLQVCGQTNSAAPVFHVGAFGNYRDETVNAVESKMGWAYGGLRPIELVAYYGIQGLHPPEMWRDDLDRLLDDRLDGSPFRRVWVFDYGSKTIAYVRPQP